MKVQFLMVLALAAALIGCATAETRVERLAEPVGGEKSWLGPVTGGFQEIARDEGLHYARRTDAVRAGMDLVCGVYVEGEKTYVVYKVANRGVTSIRMQGLQIDLEDPSLKAMGRATTLKLIDAPDVRSGTSSLGQWSFDGVPAGYPLTVTWKFPAGTSYVFTFAGPMQ